MTIIGISGYAGVGKDAVADILVTRYKFSKAGFADPLRDMLTALNPVVTAPGPRSLRYRHVVDILGYTKAKQRIPEVRRLLQRMGTEAGRDVLGEDVFVNATMHRLTEGVDWVLPDMRFPNELAAVQAAGGVTVRMARPGVTAINDHPSETALDDAVFDHIIINDGTIESLRYKVERMMNTTRTPV